ncbi:hypothetical protein HYV86_06385 [Candidatus Woesearchaeota archaeon]|nr:hypothetical protein [Candidatus Woesearchaeota archaeon]
MKQEKKQSHSVHAFFIIIGIVIIATFFISLGTYLKVSNLEQDQRDQEVNALTGQAQKALVRETVSLDITQTVGSDCQLEKTGPTSFILTHDCAYAFHAQITGKSGDLQRVGIYQTEISPPSWNYARLAQYSKTQGWDPKILLKIPYTKKIDWDVELRVAHMPGEYIYRISTINANCKQTWSHIPRKQCQGFLEGAYQDYAITVQ